MVLFFLYRKCVGRFHGMNIYWGLEGQKLEHCLRKAVKAEAVIS